MKKSILDRLSERLFPTLALMDPQEGQAVGRQGFLQLGANLLQAGGPQAQQGGTLANIGRSIAGVDVDALQKHAMLLQASRQQRDASRRIQETVAANPAKQGETPEQSYERLGKILVDLIGVPGAEDFVGKYSNVLAQLRPQREVRARYAIRGFKEGNRYVLYRVNMDDPSDRYPLGEGFAPGANLATQEQGRRQALSAMATDAIGALEDVGQTPPNVWETILSTDAAQAVGGQSLLSENRQIQNQASRQFTEAVLRFTTGAVAPEHELRNYLRTLTIQLGDKEGNIARKLEAQRTLLTALQQLAARGEPDPNEAVTLLKQTAGSMRQGGGVNPRFDPRTPR